MECKRTLHARQRGTKNPQNLVESCGIGERDTEGKADTLIRGLVSEDTRETTWDDRTPGLENCLPIDAQPVHWLSVPSLSHKHAMSNSPSVRPRRSGNHAHGNGLYWAVTIFSSLPLPPRVV